MSEVSFPTAVRDLADSDFAVGSAPDHVWEEAAPEQDFAGGWPGLAVDEPASRFGGESLWTDALSSETRTEVLSDWLGVLGDERADSLAGEDSSTYLAFNDSFLW